MKAGSDEFETTQRRQSDAYVFCVLSANDQKTTEQLEIVRRAAPTRSVFINTSLVVLHPKLGREADPLEVEIPAIQLFDFASSRFFEKRMVFFFIATDLTNLLSVKGASEVFSGLMPATLTLRGECHSHP